MSHAALALKKLAERILAKGSDLPLAMLLELAVPVARLRDLARRQGLTPKGGYRIERAPATVLAPLLAEQRDPTQLDEVLGLLVPVPVGRPAADDSAATADTQALLALREAELVRLRVEVEHLRDVAAHQRERESDLARRLELAERDCAVLQGRLQRLAQPPAPKEGEPRGDRELPRRLRELEDEREGFLAADTALRRQLAHNQTRLRELAQLEAELEPLVPKGRRRQKQAASEPEPAPAAVRVPYFAPSFYKSLVGKERRAIERAVHAVLRFCTEGYGYPGLEVKQMGGQDTWSLRASRGLRVYFRPRNDGDIEVLELADREDQHTTLRRLKER